MMSELSRSYQRAHHRAMEKVRVRLTLSAAGLGRLSAHRVRVRHMFEHTAFCSSASGGVRCGLSVHAPLLRDAALTTRIETSNDGYADSRLRRRRAPGRARGLNALSQYIFNFMHRHNHSKTSLHLRCAG
jgi:hypothetical protein